MNIHILRVCYFSYMCAWSKRFWGYYYKRSNKYSFALHSVVWSYFFSPYSFMWTSTYVMGSFPPTDFGLCASSCTDCPLPSSLHIKIISVFQGSRKNLTSTKKLVLTDPPAIPLQNSLSEAFIVLPKQMVLTYICCMFDYRHIFHN